MRRRSLGNLNVLIHGPIRSVGVIENAALGAFGIRARALTRSLGQLQETVEMDKWDIIIVNHSETQKLDMILPMLRNKTYHANPFCVIIVVSSATSKQLIRKVLQFGGDAVINMPFTGHDIWKHIVYAVNTSRTFVRTPRYFGPCRRRMQRVLYDGVERRDRDDVEHLDPVIYQSVKGAVNA